MKRIKNIIFLIIIVIILCIPSAISKFANWYGNIATKGGELIGKKMVSSIALIPYGNQEFIGGNIAAIAKQAYDNGKDVYIKTLASKEFVKYTKDKPYNITDKSNPDFVDKSAHFKAILKKNSLQQIEGIEFEQLK